MKGIDGSEVVLEGAARIAAVEQSRFEITHFLSREEINASKANVENIFPAALVPMIVKNARANDVPR